MKTAPTPPGSATGSGVKASQNTPQPDLTRAGQGRAFAHLHDATARGRSLAFTRVELAVVIAVIALLAVVLLASLAKVPSTRKRITCVSNLQTLGLGYRIFANDHEERYPVALSTNNGGSRELVAAGATRLQFIVLSNQLAVPRMLVCPTDTRRPALTWAALTESNLSYFVGLDATDTAPMALLSGDRNLTLNGVAVPPGLLEVTTNSVLGWTAAMHRNVGNLVLGDGSVQLATSLRLAEQVRHQGGGTNRLLVP